MPLVRFVDMLKATVAGPVELDEVPRPRSRVQFGKTVLFVLDGPEGAVGGDFPVSREVVNGRAKDVRVVGCSAVALERPGKGASKDERAAWSRAMRTQRAILAVTSGLVHGFDTMSDEARAMYVRRTQQILAGLSELFSPMDSRKRDDE